MHSFLHFLWHTWAYGRASAREYLAIALVLVSDRVKRVRGIHTDYNCGSNLVFVLMNGGPRTLFFGMIIAFFGALAQAACLGEMASIIPVAGAQYHWTWHLAPKKIKMFATWMQGWTTWFGYIALQASLANVLVVQLESVIALNVETYVAGGWHTSLLVIATAVFQGLINVYAFGIIPCLEMVSSILHVALFVLVAIVLIVMAPKVRPVHMLCPHPPNQVPANILKARCKLLARIHDLFGMGFKSLRGVATRHVDLYFQHHR